MKRGAALLVILTAGWCGPAAFAGEMPGPVETRLTRIEEAILRIEEQNRQTMKLIDLTREEMNKRFEQVDRRFEQVDRRFEQVYWVLGVYSTLQIFMLGYIILLVKGLTRVEEKLLHKAEEAELSRLKQTVDAIRRVLEAEGKKIIIP